MAVYFINRYQTYNGIDGGKRTNFQYINILSIEKKKKL